MVRPDLSHFRMIKDLMKGEGNESNWKEMSASFELKNALL